MAEKYTIGIDFGTLSARAVLVRVRDGRALASESRDYRHGVVTENLPQDWALQDPADYDDVLFALVRSLMGKTAGTVRPEDVVGIGVDATSFTMVPVDKNGIPLSSTEKYRSHPHAWCKLWKHHAAQPYAEKMTSLALEKGEAFINDFGGKISSEWMYPKVLQILEEDPEIYDAADLFLDACDYIVYRLTGTPTASICSASFKAQYKDGNYLSDDFAAALDPRLKDFASTKLRAPVIDLGTCAGTLTEEAAAACGLCPGTAVSAGVIDAHVSVPGSGISRPNEMLLIIGTSICSMISTCEKYPVKGICGCVNGGILPGLYGYEAGQPCGGDCLAWYTAGHVPPEYHAAAAKNGMDIHRYLTMLAAQKNPGESGLLALDWWNGNRSVLNNAGLSGLILGYTLDTKPEDIYRALIESIAYGARRIRDHFTGSGVRVDRIYACGGIALKNQLFMQIFADVLNADIYISPSTQAPAIGSAMFAAAAAGREAGGYADIYEAIEHMSDRNYKVVHPVASNSVTYDNLYHLYCRVHDFFGVEAPNIMEKLKKTN